MAIRLLAAGAWGRMRRAFLGVFSSRRHLHTGFWAKGRHYGPHPVKNDRSSRHRGLKIKAIGAVLRARSHARGLRDAEYSEICTAPPGVPVGKKQPPRQSMHLAGQFIQKGGCGCVNDSLELESRNRLLGTLEGADHVDLVEGTIGSEVDDNRKAKGKHHGKHVAQRLDFDVKVQRRHLQDVRKTLGQQAA